MKGIILALVALAAASSLAIPLAPKHFHTLLDLQQNPLNSTIAAVTPRIINGSPATTGTFPYQVEITMLGLVVSVVLIIGWCGGSIISDTWVLTAAQCVVRTPEPLPFIVLGFLVETRSGQQTALLVSDAHTHPQYNSATRAYDFALLHTETLTFSALTGAIALPPASTSLTDIDGKTGTASGYGPTTNTQTGVPSSVLYWTTLEVTTRAACQAAYGTRIIPQSCFCAQDRTAPIGSTCSYDSGGPFTITESGVTTLIGVISFTHPTRGCDGTAQGFAKVAFARNWIDTTTGTIFTGK